MVEAEKRSGEGIAALRERCAELADEWARRMVERGHAGADDVASRHEAEALVRIVVDAAANEAHPSPAALSSPVNTLVQLRAAGGADPYDLVEALDLLAELLHGALDEAYERDTAAAHQRLARATRGLVASALLVPAGGSTAGTGAGHDGTTASSAADARDATASDGGAGAAFIRRVSHDLKNPLGTALGAADALTDEDALEDAALRQQFAAIIKRNIEKAVALIEEARQGP